MNVLAYTSSDSRQHIFKVAEMETILGTYRKALCGRFYFCTFRLNNRFEEVCKDCELFKILDELGE